MDASVADLRKDYTLQGLRETDADPNPFQQFQNGLTKHWQPAD